MGIPRWQMHRKDRSGLVLNDHFLTIATARFQLIRGQDGSKPPWAVIIPSRERSPAIFYIYRHYGLGRGGGVGRGRGGGVGMGDGKCLHAITTTLFTR